MRLRLPLLLLALAACGDDAAFMFDDAGPTPDTRVADVPRVDTREEDTGPPPMSTLYGPCVIDEQCPSGFCRPAADGYNYGQCSIPCELMIECDDGIAIGWCLEDDAGGTSCWDRCRNSLDCGRDGYLCVDVGRLGTNPGGRCVGYCEDEDTDCGDGAQCDVHQARCVATGAVRTVGADTGQACDSDDACLSNNCTEAVIDDIATGQLGGYCETTCRVRPGFQNSNFYLGDRLPAVGCPEPDQICLPVADYTQGAEGSCFQECTVDGDCREGRTCLRTIAGKRFTNGVCIPIDCTNAECPAGNTCQTLRRSDGTMIGRCRPE